MTDPIALGVRTPRHSLPLLYPGQAQKEVFVNEALARLDALAQPVITSTLSAPPATHAAGDTFLVADPASAEWTGQEGSLRIWRGGWSLSPPIPDPAGGTVVDDEARGAIATLLESLRALGILPAN